MSALQKELTGYIRNIPNSKLIVLQPLLKSLAQDDDFIIETDLTDEEKAIMAQGRKEREKGGYLPFDFN